MRIVMGIGITPEIHLLGMIKVVYHLDREQSTINQLTFDT